VAANDGGDVDLLHRHHCPNGGPAFRHTEAFSFQIATENQEETERYWNAIPGKGGTESQCGWCKDRWDLSWQITPRALTEGRFASPPPAASASMGYAFINAVTVHL
jgi:predicted 3-demethylubiquinone-9 3-methyltransferase (glyoxalase superfamily)